jgi:hypothetical protein
MALPRSLPENATLADLRRIYANLLEKLRPYGQRLMRGPSPLTPSTGPSAGAATLRIRPEYSAQRRLWSLSDSAGPDNVV